MDIYIPYAVKAADTTEANSLFEAITNIKTEERQNYFRGKYFCTKFGTQYKAEICDNVDYDDEELIDNGLAEPDFPQHKILLYAHRANFMPREIELIESYPELFIKPRTRVV